MSFKVAKIPAIFLFLGSVLLPVNGWAVTNLRGSAALSYMNYDVTENGKHYYSGSSFVQNYSLAYTANNLYYKNQQNYYNLIVGYDLINFATSIDQPDMETSIKQHTGRLRYSGQVGYRAAAYPISFSAYTNDNDRIYISNEVNDPAALLDDPLVYSIHDPGKSISSGFSLSFDAKSANNATVRALPSFYLDYQETTNKNSSSYYPMDSKSRKISVAGLNQANNWVNFRFLDYEDYLRPENNSVRQQFQIGHVDPVGKRKWSALTNWIEVSADGKLSTIRGSDILDEYDLNFMAIATRSYWTARTFMNYNRIMEKDISVSRLTETTRVPVYVRGVYGPQTDWYMRFSAERGTRIDYESAIGNESSYANLVSLGATTYKRELFNLAPSLVAKLSKGFGGVDVLELLAAVETNSTAKFSNKLVLGGKLATKYRDDGRDIYENKSLDNLLDLRADYSPNRKIFYSFRENLMFGEAVPASYVQGQSGPEKYLASSTTVRITWLQNAAFSTWLESLYETQKNEDGADSTRLQFKHNLTIDKKGISVRLNTYYSQIDKQSNRRQELANSGSLLGDNSTNSGSSLDTNLKNSGNFFYSNLYNSSTFSNTGDLQYRPDRYIDALLRYHYALNDYDSTKSNQLEITQRYSYNFFTRAGVLRNFATFTQEAGYKRDTNTVKLRSGSDISISSRYLGFSGRYSPTEKLSLYGSVKYEQFGSFSTILYYGGGMSANFKLLSTSLDYSYAKRDSDNRVEKKLSAAVSRTF